MTNMTNMTNMTSLDTNAWYQLTETRVDFNSSLQAPSNVLYMAKSCPSCDENYWQFLHLSGNTYQLRNRKSTYKKQLSACYVSDEVDTSRTRPCMAPSSDDDSQKWNINPYPEDDGSYYFENVANGSNYRLDCHKGNPLFMSSNISDSQPAQRWLFSSISAVDNADYSTVFTATPTSSSSSTTTTSRSPKTAAASTTQDPTQTSTSLPITSSQPSSDRLSAGAIAGIGVSVGLAVLLTISLLIICVMRKRHRARLARVATRNAPILEIPQAMQPQPGTEDMAWKDQKWSKGMHEVPGAEAQITELYVPPTEMDAGGGHLMPLRLATPELPSTPIARESSARD